MKPKTKPGIKKDPVNLPGEFWGVTTYFNPSQSSVRLQNLMKFSQNIRNQGLKLLIVEAARHGSPFEITGDMADLVVHRRTDAVLWQKERLLNIGFENLPHSCDKVAWLDCDILFENQDWVTETSSLLENYVAVQPFETACWLHRGETTTPDDLPRAKGLENGHYMPSMAFCLANRNDWRRAMADYFEHGHTGFAWAIRRDVLDQLHLYDSHVLGGGDVIIAHALYGDSDFQRGLNVYCRYLSKPELAHMTEWSHNFSEKVQKSVYFTKGRVMHLWHGDISKRNYMDRLKILKDINYDPKSHLRLDENNCWRWNYNNKDFHLRIRNYFNKRSMDNKDLNVGISENG